MYNIDLESVQKLIEINKMMNLLEVRGASNISLMYNSMVMMQDVLSKIEKQTNGITIDNTNKGG